MSSASLLVAVFAGLVLLLAPYSAFALNPVAAKRSASLEPRSRLQPRGFKMDIDEAAAGCKAHTTAEKCHRPCEWCTSAAVPSACYGPKAAARLPPGVFECK